jgi:hypothetical protein
VRFALSGTEQDVTRPLGPVTINDAAHDLVFGGCEADLSGDGAPLVFGEWWPSGTRVHALRIAGHGKLRKRVDTMTYAGHNKDMEITKGQTFTLKGTGEITVSRIVVSKWGETRVTVTGAARFTISADELVRLIEKVGA